MENPKPESSLASVTTFHAETNIMAISKETAQLQQLNPTAIQSFAERIAAGEDPSQVIMEVAVAASEAPGAVGRINRHLNNLLVEEKLLFDRGVFVATEGFNQQDAERIITNTVNLANDTEGVGNLGRWVLGNIAVMLEDQGFALGDLVQPTGMAYNTIAKSAKTFREFKDKRYALPFAHHAELAYSKDLPQEGKFAVLQLATDNEIPLLQTRAVAKHLQTRVRAHDVPENWTEAAQAAYDTVLNETKTEKTPLYGIVSQQGFSTIPRKPTREEVEEALFVFKIGSVIKRPDANGAPAEETNGGDDAGGTIPEAV